MSFEWPKNIRLATLSDVPLLRILVNEAYHELLELGLNFTGAYQDEEITRERMKDAEVYLYYREDILAASFSLTFKSDEPTHSSICYLNQLAVHPEMKRQGIGAFLLDTAEAYAKSLGITRMRLDTAIPATHLVEMYCKRSFVVIDETQWDDKTYRSYIMEKTL